MYLGFVGIGNTLIDLVQVRNTSQVPTDADALPHRTVYGPNGPLATVAGQASLEHSGSVSGATSGNPTTINSPSHNLQTGMRIYISGVGGLTSWADGYYTVTVTDSNNFTIPLSTSGSYTSGGTWHVAGLYQHSLVCSAGNGFAQGVTYYVLTSYAVSSSNQAQLDSFTVV